MAVICFSADCGLFFGYKAMVMRIVEDANRAVSIGRLISADATEAYVKGRLGAYGDNATVEVTWDKTTGLVQTVVEIPTKDVTATSILETLSVETLYISEQRLTET